MSKLSILALVLALLIAAPVFAAEKIVSVEGPVEVVTAEGDREAVYWVEDQNNNRYRVTLSQPERQRLASVLRAEPQSVIRFDGHIVDNESGRSLNVDTWKSVTTKTRVIDQHGNTTTVEETTTTLE